MKTTHVRIWKALVMALVLFMLPFASASAFVDPPTFSPAQPYAGQPIDMSVRGGICHAFVTPPPGYPYVEVQAHDDVVDVIITGVEATDPILCIFGIGTITVDIGELPQGNYIVQVRIRKTFPPFEVLPPASTANLVVHRHPTLVTVPAASRTALLSFAGLLILLGVATLKRSARVLALALAPALLASPKMVNAQDNRSYIFVEISTNESAPTPQQIVDEFDLGSGLPPPISALSVENPDFFEYFIPREFRARGDFKSYLESNTELPRARLEQTIIARYPDTANLSVALAALLADPYVRHANIPEPLELSAPPRRQANKHESDSAPAIAEGSATQYWIDAMNFTGAWSRAGGWSRVGVIDNGLYVDHPDLRSQNASGALTGGNALSSAAIDLGRHGFANPIDFNVDEMEPVAITSPAQNVCDPQGTGFLVPAFAGHGTHVHGLIAANHSNADGVVGACKNCGLASIRALKDECSTFDNLVYPVINSFAVWAGLTIHADTGTQVVNMSFGGAFARNYCANPAYANSSECMAVAYADSQGVLMVASSGNDRRELNFPASDPRVASVGGLDESLDFWDEDRDSPPNHVDDCPFYGSNNPGGECGSNYTVNAATDAKQEHVAPARRVLSTLYPGMPWSPTILCDDAALGTNGDGQGPCTGTSMSAPLVSGLAGILRSINPLVLPGEGVLDPPYRGIRSVLIESSMLPTFPNTWDPRLGYGTIRADSAVAAMLGHSDGKAMKNRLTPLFSFYGAAAKDWAHTTVPQAALAFMINQAGSYQPQGALTPGYPSFPYQYPTPPPPSPRASAYVLTTEFKVDASHPALVPLYWLDRSRPWPAGCTPGVPGCNGGNRDFLLLTSAAQVQTASNAGYDYRGLQGYVYQSCTPEPACIPQGAERLWLKCKSADDDCAVFLERERSSFEAQGYTSA